jgi:hypothetical protein
MKGVLFLFEAIEIDRGRLNIVAAVVRSCRHRYNSFPGARKFPVIYDKKLNARPSKNATLELPKSKNLKFLASIFSLNFALKYRISLCLKSTSQNAVDSFAEHRSRTQT